jgi:two-component system response regulator FixJ
MSEAGQHVVLVEDDAGVRSGLTALLESWGYRVTAEPDAEALLAAGVPEDAACLVIDLRLPGMDGLALVTELRGQGVTVPVLMISAHGDVEMAVEAMRRGAQDFIEKPFDDTPFIQRIEAIRAVPSPAAAEPAAATDPDARARLGGLTAREAEVMREVVAGRPNKVIAHRLGISLKTVEMHRARVMKKTGASTLAHLVRIAVAAGFEGPERS